MIAKRILAGIGVVFGLATLGAGARSVVDLAVWHSADLPEHSYENPGAVVIDIDGSVTLTTRPAGGEDTIDVAMHASGGLSMPKPTVHTHGDVLEISGGCPTTWLTTGTCTLDVTLTVPEGTRVTIDSGAGNVVSTGRLAALAVSLGSGDITVADVGTGVTLDTSSGDIRVSGAADPVAAHTGSGNVQVSDAGDVEALSSSGDVTVEATGAVTATSGSGRVSVDGATGAVTARSSAGDVSVTGVRGQSRGPVVAKSGSGQVSVTGIDGDATAHSSAGDVVVEAGGNVDASSGSGNVTVYAWAANQPVALDISTGSGDSYTGAATDPNAATTVRIHSSAGDVSYSPPR